MKLATVLFYFALALYAATAYGNNAAQSIVAQQEYMMNDLLDIKKEIAVLNPKLIEQIKNLEDKEQLSILRGYLAEKAFEFYYDKYIADIKEKSTQTGRKIYKENSKNDNCTTTVAHLDRGSLESDECKIDITKRQACDWPDGFEEYVISYEICNYSNPQTTSRELVIDKDNKSENTRQFIDIVLSDDRNVYSQNHANEYSSYNGISIDMTATTEKYEERHRYRNEMAADIRAGLYIQNTKNHEMWETDSSKNWPSMNWMPDAAVLQVTVENTKTYGNTESVAEY